MANAHDRCLALLRAGRERAIGGSTAHLAFKFCVQKFCDDRDLSPQLEVAEKNLAMAGRGAGGFLGGCARSPQFCKTVPGL